MASSADRSAPPSCPVDHKSREAWLDKARAASAASSATTDSASTAFRKADPCNSSQLDGPSPPRVQDTKASQLLGTQREVSSIPRTDDTAGPGRAPANHEQETAPSASGNWIYPSEQMFFNAMRRKEYDPKTQDMKMIVPIHNAVNERAWKEIREWEKGWGAERCGGPRLHSFFGNAQAMTPKARFNTLLGYSAPFDRHDWVVDRCGTKLEYVIDFYAGKDDGSGKKLNFYLDVRPKLNSWTGVKMRLARALGMA